MAIGFLRENILKFFFKKNGDKVYIKKVGVSVGETGVSDLDS